MSSGAGTQEILINECSLASVAKTASRDVKNKVRRVNECQIHILTICVRIDGWGGDAQCRNTTIDRTYQFVLNSRRPRLCEVQSSMNCGRINIQARSAGRRVGVSCVLWKKVWRRCRRAKGGKQKYRRDVELFRGPPDSCPAGVLEERVTYRVKPSNKMNN
jgi:hypothetical protein